MSEEEFDLLMGGYSPEDASHYAGVLMAAKARRRAIDS